MHRFFRLLFFLTLFILPGLLSGATRKKEQKTGGGASVSSSLAPTVAHLTVEGRINPLGLDELRPRFGWQIADTLQGLVQRGYRILVASSPDSLSRDRGDLWDSGAVTSAESQWVPYGGRELQPNQECYWKVRVLTNHGTSAWSAPARWSVGLLEERCWTGQWIGVDQSFAWDREEAHSRLSARYLRRDFTVRTTVRQATLHIAGLGYYEAYIDGHRVGTQVMAPAPTDYRYSIIYNSYDIAPLLPTGPACLAVVLGNGRYYSPLQHLLTNRIANYGYPTLRVDLIIEYTDGTADTIASDDRWKVATAGPICSNNLIDGEVYDATRESLMAHWTQPGYVDDYWMDADLVAGPGGVMTGNLTPSPEVVEILRPVAVFAITPSANDAMPTGRGRYLVDFGRCVSGRVRLHVSGRGRSGDHIRLRYSVALDADGYPDFEDAEAASVSDCYICNGTDTTAAAASVVEGTSGTWAPSFVTHRFRYVEITNYPSLTVDDISAEVISSPMRRTGYFNSSDSCCNRLVAEAYARLRMRCQGLPLTDEAPRLPLTVRETQTIDLMPQPWVVAGAEDCTADAWLADVYTLYAKWLRDIVQAQRSDGAPADAAPAYWRSYSGDTAVLCASNRVADMLRTHYGDVRPAECHAEALQRMARFMKYDATPDAVDTSRVCWAFRDAAGIRCGADGWRQIQLAPEFESCGITWVDATYESPCGPIVSHWEMLDAEDRCLQAPADTYTLVWNVEIPGNVTAQLQLPRGARLEQMEGAPKSARKDRRAKTLTLGSGRYRLTVPVN